MDRVGAVYSKARQMPWEKGKTMYISMNTTSSRRMSHRWENFSLEIRKKLAKAFEHLSLIISADIARQMEQSELKNREEQRYEHGYEARKRKLLVSLRHKISEKQTKID